MLEAWNQFFFATLKQYSQSCAVLPLAAIIFKSAEEKRKDPTEVAKCLNSAVFYTE